MFLFSILNSLVWATTWRFTAFSLGKSSEKLVSIILPVFTWRHSGHVGVQEQKNIWWFLLFSTPTWPLRLLSLASLGSVWKPRISAVNLSFVKKSRVRVNQFLNEQAQMANGVEDEVKMKKLRSFQWGSTQGLDSDFSMCFVSGIIKRIYYDTLTNMRGRHIGIDTRSDIGLTMYSPEEGRTAESLWRQEDKKTKEERERGKEDQRQEDDTFLFEVAHILI